ncbi:MAG: hypothetical protein ACNS60_10425 [Candidatus Cyclobacteriaceae bacterium M2_1C_046]
MNKTQRKFNVVYIAGNGHSGSTLLDIILGNRTDAFSGGELTAVTRESILKEYCSCNRIISECPVWTQIVNLWETNRQISYSKYQYLRNKFERNKKSLVTIKNKLIPSKEFVEYCDATYELLLAIHTVTGADMIIDSSKSAQRIAVLDRVVNLKVIHLCRDFKGVLNSAKKSYKKDISMGIEKNLPARRTSKTLLDWVLNNFLCELFCLGVYSKKVSYQSYITNKDNILGLLNEKNEEHLNYAAEHMLAGNRVRLKQNITLNPNLGFAYNRLNKRQRLLADFIDRIFWFWN